MHFRHAHFLLPTICQVTSVTPDDHTNAFQHTPGACNDTVCPGFSFGLFHYCCFKRLVQLPATPLWLHALATAYYQGSVHGWTLVVLHSVSHSCMVRLPVTATVKSDYRCNYLRVLHPSWHGPWTPPAGQSGYPPCTAIIDLWPLVLRLPLGLR